MLFCNATYYFYNYSKYGKFDKISLKIKRSYEFKLLTVK